MSLERLKADYLMIDIECRRKAISKYMNDLYNFKNVTTVPTSEVFNWIGAIHRDIKKLNDLIKREDSNAKTK